MKKIILILFIIPLFGVFSYGINESTNESISILPTIEEPDFRGVWEVRYNGNLIGFRTIWKDSRSKYKTLYIDFDNDIRTTKELYFKNNKLIIKQVYIDWETTEVLEMIDDNTINVEGINDDGSYFLSLQRLNIR